MGRYLFDHFKIKSIWNFGLNQNHHYSFGSAHLSVPCRCVRCVSVTSGATLVGCLSLSLSLRSLATHWAVPIWATGTGHLQLFRSARASSTPSFSSTLVRPKAANTTPMTICSTPPVGAPLPALDSPPLNPLPGEPPPPTILMSIPPCLSPLFMCPCCRKHHWPPPFVGAPLSP
jgi:hypothetical protein